MAHALSTLINSVDDDPMQASDAKFIPALMSYVYRSFSRRGIAVEAMNSLVFEINSILSMYDIKKNFAYVAPKILDRLTYLNRIISSSELFSTAEKDQFAALFIRAVDHVGT